MGYPICTPTISPIIYCWSFMLIASCQVSKKTILSKVFINFKVIKTLTPCNKYIYNSAYLYSMTFISNCSIMSLVLLLRSLKNTNILSLHILPFSVLLSYLPDCQQIALNIFIQGSRRNKHQVQQLFPLVARTKGKRENTFY